MKEKYLNSISNILDGITDKETTKKIMENLTRPQEPLPEGEREYLTIQEFLNEGETATDIIIFTKKYDKYRCHCSTPVRNLKYNAEHNILEWSDNNGDPRLNIISLDQKMIDLNNCSKYSTTVFRIKK